MSDSTCPICGAPTPRGGFCKDCERRLDKRFPNGAWEMMEIEDIRAALLSGGTAEIPPAPGVAVSKAPASKRKGKTPAASARPRSAAKQNAPSPMRRIVPGVLLVALMAWLAPRLVGDMFAYHNAPVRQEAQAVLDSYEWSWDSDREQFRVNARYRWIMGGSSGTVSHTQYNTPASRSRTSRPELAQKGKDGDPAEVRPHASIKVRLLQQPDGKWRLAPTQGVADSLSLIAGCAATLVLGVWLSVSGLRLWLRKGGG